MRDFFLPGRSPIVAQEAAIATSHPLATSAGLAILRDGGNAVDAALAAVAVQCVVEPHMTGIGGDCFALYAPKGRDVVALNGSGRAPAAASAAQLRAEGLRVIAHESAHAVTVPGAVSAWTRLHADHGTMALERLFAPAIEYAERGHALTARVASDWTFAAPALARHAGTASVFLAAGVPPAAGDRHRQPRLAQRLRDIARHGAGAFYLGATARSLVSALNARGGVHTEDDFAAGMAVADYVDPIATQYRGFEILECPPNGQGVVALMILNILSGFDLSAQLPLAERMHLHAEATKQAYHNRDSFLSDPAHLPHSVETLLSARTSDALRGRIARHRAGPGRLWTETAHQDTICLSVIDRDGNAISFINSLFQAFGSYILDPDSGVLLHSRGSSFRLEEGHPNELRPHKRPLHTIIPAMARRQGKVVMPFGVMGGHYQAAGHAALLSGLLDQGLDIQAAIDAPRSFAFNHQLEVEPSVDAHTLRRLESLGHDVRPALMPIGGAQALWMDQARGVIFGGSDPRKDGCALGF